jgi:hypothetical protein
MEPTFGGNLQMKKMPLLAIVLVFWGGAVFAQSINYRSLRIIAMQMYNEGVYDEGEFYIDNSSSNVVYLQGCSRAGLSGGWYERDEDYTRGALEEIAMQVITMHGTLQREGFERQQWEPVVQEFEQQAVSIATRYSGEAGHKAFFDTYLPLLQSKVTNLANSLGPSPRSGRLVSDDVDGECGDGGIWVQITTLPAGGRVWLMSEFDFRLCRSRGHDPWTSGQCRFNEYTDSDMGLVAGNYQYLAQWPDGTQSRGARSFLDEFFTTGSDIIRISQWAD